MSNICDFELCPGQDLNLHVLANTSPSSWRVYRFHHLGSIASAKVNLFNYLQKKYFYFFDESSMFVQTESNQTLLKCRGAAEHHYEVTSL